MTKLDILNARLDMASHNLFCYSANYAMTEPRSGDEKEWAECKEEIALLKEMIDEHTAIQQPNSALIALLSRAADALREYGDDPCAIINEIEATISAYNAAISQPE